ncbi:MAG: RluA family pseudouridine synthase [Lentisphaeria bacterium]
MHYLPSGIGIIYEDNHLLVVLKPAGMGVQGDESGDLSLLDLCKLYIKEKYEKPGEVFLGLVHRLDRPVSGVVVFARTSKAASRLSEQFRNHSNDKLYLAICEGRPPKQGKFVDYLLRKERNSVVTKNTKEGKYSELSYTCLAHKENLSLVKINLETGRHHQIRVQFSSRKFPLLGDFRYGNSTKFPNRSIALHAYELQIDHPISKKRMIFRIDNPSYWPI